MGILDIFKKTEPKDDVVFGRIEWNPAGFWYGNIKFHADDVQIFVTGTKSGPKEEAYPFFKELDGRYSEIKKQVTTDLFGLYRNYHVDVDLKSEPDFPLLNSADDIWKHALLETISILRSDKLEFSLILGYSMDWHQDHDFDFPIVDWKVEGVSING